MKFIKNDLAKEIIRATLYAVVLTMGAVLVLAAVLVSTDISDGAINPIVQVIKVISIFVGVMFALRSLEKNGWMFGGLVGLLYTVIAFLIFSIIHAEFSITQGLLTDIFFAGAIGAISALTMKMLRTPAI